MATTERSRTEFPGLVVIPPHRIGEPERVGEIVELLGAPGHERYHLRWDDDQEEIVDLPAHATIRRRAPG
jgi:Domain of unknown function (DUF1918)